MSIIAVVGELHAKPGQFEQLLALSKQHAVASRAEPGCLRFDVVVPNEGQDQLRFFELWTDQASLDAHGATERIAAHRNASGPLTIDRNISFGKLVDSADL